MWKRNKERCMQWTIYKTGRWQTLNPVWTLWANVLGDWLKALITVSLRNMILGKETVGPVTLLQEMLTFRKRNPRWNLFWCHADIQIKEYPNLSYKAIKLFVTLSTIDSCWEGCWILSTIKTKFSERMKVGPAPHLTGTTLHPRRENILPQ